MKNNYEEMAENFVSSSLLINAETKAMIKGELAKWLEALDKKNPEADKIVENLFNNQVFVNEDFFNLRDNVINFEEILSSEFLQDKQKDQFLYSIRTTAFTKKPSIKSKLDRIYQSLNNSYKLEKKYEEQFKKNQNIDLVVFNKEDFKDNNHLGYVAEIFYDKVKSKYQYEQIKKIDPSFVKFVDETRELQEIKANLISWRALIDNDKDGARKILENLFNKEIFSEKKYNLGPFVEDLTSSNLLNEEQKDQFLYSMLQSKNFLSLIPDMNGAYNNNLMIKKLLTLKDEDKFMAIINNCMNVGTLEASKEADPTHKLIDRYYNIYDNKHKAETHYKEEFAKKLDISFNELLLENPRKAHEVRATDTEYQIKDNPGDLFARKKAYKNALISHISGLSKEKLLNNLNQLEQRYKEIEKFTGTDGTKIYEAIDALKKLQNDPSERNLLEKAVNNLSENLKDYKKLEQICELEKTYVPGILDISRKNKRTISIDNFMHKEGMSHEQLEAYKDALVNRLQFYALKEPGKLKKELMEISSLKYFNDDQNYLSMRAIGTLGRDIQDLDSNKIKQHVNTLFQHQIKNPDIYAKEALVCLKNGEIANFLKIIKDSSRGTIEYASNQGLKDLFHSKKTYIKAKHYENLFKGEYNNNANFPNILIDFIKHVEKPSEEFYKAIQNLTKNLKPGMKNAVDKALNDDKNISEDLKQKIKPNLIFEPREKPIKQIHVPNSEEKKALIFGGNNYPKTKEILIRPDSYKINKTGKGDDGFKDEKDFEEKLKKVLNHQQSQDYNNIMLFAHGTTDPTIDYKLSIPSMKAETIFKKIKAASPDKKSFILLESCGSEHAKEYLECLPKGSIITSEAEASYSSYGYEIKDYKKATDALSKSSFPEPIQDFIRDSLTQNSANSTQKMHYLNEKDEVISFNPDEKFEEIRNNIEQHKDKVLFLGKMLGFDKAKREEFYEWFKESIKGKSALEVKEDLVTEKAIKDVDKYYFCQNPNDKNQLVDNLKDIQQKAPNEKHSSKNYITKFKPDQAINLHMAMNAVATLATWDKEPHFQKFFEKDIERMKMHQLKPELQKIKEEMNKQKPEIILQQRKKSEEMKMPEGKNR